MGEWLVEAPVAGLVFARCGGMLAVLPPLNVRGFPVLLRLGIAALLTLALAPMAPVGPVEAAPAPGMYLALLVREAAVGALAGFAGALVFAGFMIAGQLLDALLQAGEQQTRAAGHGPVTGLTYLLAATLLVAADGHHWLLAALVEGMRVLPPGSGWALLEVSAVARSAGARRRPRVPGAAASFDLSGHRRCSGTWLPTRRAWRLRRYGRRSSCSASEVRRWPMR